MRVSTSQIFNQGIQQFQNLNAQQARTQEQVATGKEVLRPSDDPVASTRIVQLKDDLARSEQYQDTLDMTQTRLEREDGALSSYTDALARTRELMVQAGSGSLSESDRESIAQELRQVKDQMVSIANTQGPEGEFLFAGFQGGEKPFGEDVSGNIEYRGDSGERSVQIDDGVTLKVNDNGRETFEAIDSDRPTFNTRADSGNGGSGRISTGVVTDREAFESFYPDDLVVAFEENGGDTQYTVKSEKTGEEFITDEDYTSGSPIEVNGMRFEVSGEPEGGDSFRVETGDQQSIFGTMEKMIEGLETHPNTPEGREALEDTIDQGLANLQNAEDRATEIQSGVGTRLNTVETTQEFLKDSDLLAEETLSDLEDVDYAEAISRLTQQNFTLQAAQQSFAQISRLSLFDAL
ncbi:flagellar hook-associated protein 3 [Halovibrio salipaludis]|uniref:Flagellar hook-associated protein 3 n=1 Tax=Halovibrio salipaludis TaxID=2032626 RepID=A0A2A2F4I4_9GAMM|nr:flagellar hook-associated protein FlgL [Halovibrio salipaludis]PAU80356.1 flagellar hook-associated protein 3 [Halovibrio salipaludis]